MPELIAKPSLELAPLALAGCVLTAVELGQITSIALFPGAEKLADKALKTLGLSFPAANSLSQSEKGLLVWTGRDQAFLIGVEAPDMGKSAALTDQSGGWAALRLSGAKAADVLMRHVPLDLRVAAFPPGRAVRVPFGHMSSVLWRDANGDFTVLVFRSMVRSAWHELETALHSVAARAA